MLFLENAIFPAVSTVGVGGTGVIVGGSSVGEGCGGGGVAVGV